MNGTGAVQLASRSARGLEPKLFSCLFYADEPLKSASDNQPTKIGETQGKGKRTEDGRVIGDKTFSYLASKQLYWQHVWQAAREIVACCKQDKPAESRPEPKQAEAEKSNDS